MKKHVIPLLAILCVTILVAAVFTFLAVPQNLGLANSKFLVGAWEVEISLESCSPCSWPGAMNFFADGNLITDELPSPLETSGHGEWIKTGPEQAGFTFVFFIGDPDPVKWIKGTVDGNAVYESGSDTWTGEFVITLVDQDGNPVVYEPGTMSGIRITVP